MARYAGAPVTTHCKTPKTSQIMATKPPLARWQGAGRPGSARRPPIASRSGTVVGAPPTGHVVGGARDHARRLRGEEDHHRRDVLGLDPGYAQWRLGVQDCACLLLVRFERPGRSPAGGLDRLRITLLVAG